MFISTYKITLFTTFTCKGSRLEFKTMTFISGQEIAVPTVNENGKRLKISFWLNKRSFSHLSYGQSVFTELSTFECSSYIIRTAFINYAFLSIQSHFINEDTKNKINWLKYIFFDILLETVKLKS